MTNVDRRRGDALRVLKGLDTGSIQACITSPPFWAQRDYGHHGQIGTEATPGEYIARLVRVFGELRRVLRDDGTLWLNLGDVYVCGGTGGKTFRTSRGRIVGKRPNARVEGLATSNLVGIPWRVAFALQADGWILRSEIIWHKPYAVPEGQRRRPSRSHEHLFMLSKTPHYYWSKRGATEPGLSGRRVLRTVWTIPQIRGERGSHTAPWPAAIPERCILASTRRGDTVLDPFAGSGTTLKVARRLGRASIGIDLDRIIMDEERPEAIALEAAGGNVSFAARALGMPRTTLVDRLSRMERAHG